MREAIGLAHGFVVGILLVPAESLEVQKLMEADRIVRREDALLRSGPPVELTLYEQQALNDPNLSMGIVAIDLQSGRYIGHASVHRMVTKGRGTKIDIEEVVSHPEFEGRGVGKAIMAVALREGRERWGARKAVLTSRASRVAARGLYAVFGFVLEGEDRFVLKFGEGYWMPPEAARPRSFGHHCDRVVIGALMHTNPELGNVVGEICVESGPIGSRNILEPIGVYKYKGAS